MGEPTYSLEALAENPQQQAALTDEQLHDLLIADKIIFDEGEIDNIKPVSVMLIWTEAEVLSIIQSIQGEVDQPVTTAEINEQLAYLHLRFESMMALLDVIKKYRAILVSLKEQYPVFISQSPGESSQKVRQIIDEYITTFIAELRAYLQAEDAKEYRKNTVPFPIEITKLPLALLSLTPDDLQFFERYIHDLVNIIGTASQTILNNFDTGLGLGDSFAEFALESVQTALYRIIEFHKPYQMDELSYNLVEMPLLDMRSMLSREFRTKKERARRDPADHVVSPEKPIEFLIDDQSKEFGKKFMPEDRDAMDNVRSFFSTPFGIKLISNIKQNIERVNNQLGSESDKLISQVVAAITFEFLDLEQFPTVEDQKMIDGKAVWVTLKVSDNGPGFPPGAEDHLAEVDGKQVRLYQPESGKSSHNGEGIGLAGIKADVEAAGGFFETYTSVDEGGATIYISFPLLNALV